MPAPSFSTPELVQLNDRVDAAMDHFRKCLWTLIELFGSQTALSEASNIGLSTLRKYYYPERPADPSLSNVLHFHFVLGISLPWLCYGEDRDTCRLRMLDTERAAPRDLRFTDQFYPLRADLIARHLSRQAELFVALCRNLETEAERPVRRPAVVRGLARPRADLPDGLYLLRSPDGDVLRRLPAADAPDASKDVLGRCVWTWHGAMPA